MTLEKLLKEGEGHARKLFAERQSVIPTVFIYSVGASFPSIAVMPIGTPDAVLELAIAMAEPIENMVAIADLYESRSANGDIELMANDDGNARRVISVAAEDRERMILGLMYVLRSEDGKVTLSPINQKEVEK